MNTVSKVFCRVFQTAFHLALPVLPYRTPEIYDTIAGIGPLLRERKVGSVLLITDSALRSAGLTVPLETLLREQGVMTEEQMQAIRAEISAKIDAAVATAEATPEPTPEDLYRNLYAEQR